MYYSHRKKGRRRKKGKKKGRYRSWVGEIGVGDGRGGNREIHLKSRIQMEICISRRTGSISTTW